MTDIHMLSLLMSLRALPHETEWVEFKHNNDDPEMIGERISGLANSAALLRKDRAYFVWGIEDTTHRIVGTTFQPRRKKVGNEDFEPWLIRLFDPRIEMRFYEFLAEEQPVVLLEIWPCLHTPRVLLVSREEATERVSNVTPEEFAAFQEETHDRSPCRILIIA